MPNTSCYDGTLDGLKELHEMPLLECIYLASRIHAAFHKIGEVQVCQLLSIKTGGCPEDCKYCAQSSRYTTSTKAEPMLTFEKVMEEAKKAVQRGVTRICLGAAWRQIRDSKQFEEVLQMVKAIADLGVEVCCTLGMLNEEQARRLKQAGLYAYNHNLDTSEKFYKTIITSRKYEDRLKTLDIVQKTGLSICSGGILGMGESTQDRLELLYTLSKRNPPPDSVPINALSPIPGTPLGNLPKISPWEIVRFVALARIVMPKAMIRLSSGRIEMTEEMQALCFLAGANSIFGGEKLLTVANSSLSSDEKMFQNLGLVIKQSQKCSC